MLDSGGMTEREDNPPTLASLRARRGKIRSAKGASSPSAAAPLFAQTGLVFAPAEPVPPPTPKAEPPALQAAATERPRRQVQPVAPVERRIWSVRALVTDIRQHVETAYIDLWVEGEISNCRPAPSGHVYFTLKEAKLSFPSSSSDGRRSCSASVLPTALPF